MSYGVYRYYWPYYLRAAVRPVGGGAVVAGALPLADSATASDAMAFDVSHPLSDSATATDTLVSDYSMGLADSVTATDSGLANAVSHPLSDSATASDAIVNAPSTVLSDSATATDSGLANAVSHPLSDSVTPTDADAKSDSIVLSDSVTASESLSPSLSSAGSQSLGDNVTPTDAMVFDLSHPLSDSATPTDALANAVSHPLADSATASDANVQAVGKVLADNVTPSESLATDAAPPVLLSKALGDSVTLLDDFTRNHRGAGYRATTRFDIARWAPPRIVRPQISARALLGRQNNVVLLDSFAIGDSLRAVRENQDLADSFGTSDGLTTAFGKVLGDSVTVGDSQFLNPYPPKPIDPVTASDVLTMAVGHPLADSATASDAAPTKLVNKVLSDSVTMGDSDNLHTASFIGSATNTQVQTTTPRSVTFPAGSAAGDLALVFGVGLSTPVVTTLSGTTWPNLITYSAVGQEQCYWKILDATDISDGSCKIVQTKVGPLCMLVYRGATSLSMRVQTALVNTTGGSITATGVIPSGNTRGMIGLFTSYENPYCATTTTNQNQELNGVASYNYSHSASDALPYTSGSNFTCNFAHSLGSSPGSPSGTGSATAWMLELIA